MTYGHIRYITSTVIFLLLIIALPWTDLSAQSYEYNVRFWPSGGAESDYFGSAVDIEGNRALIGAYGAGAGGAAYLYQFNGTDWILEKTFSAEEPQSYNFGCSAALSGNHLIIGARSHDNGKGAAYIYVNTGSGWVLEQKLMQENPEIYRHFGSVVEIHEDIAIVSTKYNNDYYSDYNYVYAYRLENGSWNLIAQFQGGEGYATDLDFDGHFLAVGEYYAAQVQVMEYDGETWAIQDTIQGSGASFSAAVAVSGNNIVAGYWGDATNGRNSGSASVYHYTGSQWQFIQKLYPLDADADDTFGRATAIDGNTMLIGAPETYSYGSAYIFQYNGSTWQQIAKLTNIGGTQYASFGGSVAMDGSAMIIGASGDDVLAPQSGTVSVFEFVHHPNQMQVSNGTYSNRNTIKWTNGSQRSLDNYFIYRDGVQIGSTVSTSYTDYDGIPGKIHTYSVSANTASWGESMPSPGFGWQKSNGKLEGKVRTKIGAFVENVEMQLLPEYFAQNTGLSFDTTDDFMITNPFAGFPDTAITISFWMRSSVSDHAGTPFSYAAGTNYNTFLIYDHRNLEIATAGQPTVTTGIALNDGAWHHIAVTWRSETGEVNVVKDGTLAFTRDMGQGYSIPDNGCLVIGQDQDALAGGFDPTQAFIGDLDELRIWNYARSEEAIQAQMYSALKGDEEGLTAYWHFDDNNRAPGIIAGDYAVKGGHHGTLHGTVYSDGIEYLPLADTTDSGGKFTFSGLYYGESGQFELTPVKQGHGFDPAQQTIILDVDAPLNKSLSFIDTTAFSVTGIIRHEGTECGVSDVDLFVNGKPTNVKTDKFGAFSLSIDDPGPYTISYALTDGETSHRFKPADTTLIIEQDILGLEIRDTQQHLFYGKVRGVCNTLIGKADVRISSYGQNTGCFEDTIRTDDSGNFRVFLPAQPYMVEMIKLEPANPIILEYFSTDTVDLTWCNREKIYTYRTPPVIKISGWPEIGGGEFRVPILDQADRYKLLIEILDVNGEDSCHVNQGSITMYDGIADKESNPVTLELENGMAFYELRPGRANILGGGDHPYQKMLQVVAHVGEETVSIEQWAVVTGVREREQRFYTKSPQLVHWILHDPPGDGSYAFMIKDSSYSSVTRTTSEFLGGGGIFADLQIGSIWSEGISFGAGVVKAEVSFDFGLYAIFGLEVFAGYEGKSSNATILTFKSSEDIRTSGSDLVTGDDGDLFVGLSYNYVYGLVDVLNYDWTTHTVDRDTSIMMGVSGIESTFHYTESHIRKVLMPELNTLRQIEAAAGNTTEADDYQKEIDGWQFWLDLNEDNKAKAKTKKNISFSSGAPYTYSETIGGGTEETTSNKFVFDLDLKLGVGIVAMGCTYEFGALVKIHSESGTETGTTIDTSMTYGYHLEDDDPGDFFSVDIRHQTDSQGNFYGPPIFGLVSGVSSNPWEKGTQPRDGVQMDMNKYVQYNVAPDDPAAFILYLGNTSQSDETREYHLSVIQSSNLDGAVIRVGGVVIEDYLSYTIPAGEQLNATLTVERGPIAYDYENLQLKFYAPGDEEAIADTVSFSVHYISPCSDVKLLEPQGGWLVNQSDGDTLMFVITEYDLNNPHLEFVKFQYRRQGEGWKTPFIYAKDELSPEYILEYWNIANLPDGAYQLRAVSDCGTKGTKYSDIAEGIIDRQALVVFGNPQPSDGVLNIGEEIRVAFSGEIDDAYVQANRHVFLMDMADSSYLDIEVSVFENTMVIIPLDSMSVYEGKTLQARVTGIRDVHGNVLRRTARWQFLVNYNPVYWTVANAQHTVYQGRDDRFTRILTNAGGQEEGFTITSHPAWLVPNPRNGSIPSGGQQEITFQVNSQLNRGHYRDTVTVSTSRGEEYLIVDLDVLHQPPSWEIDPSGFAWSMEITARLAFEDTLSRDAFDLVSVYVDGALRGVAHVEKLSAVDQYLAFITVYSNQSEGGTLTFRMWDASQGREYAYLGSSHTFLSNSSLGTVSSPLILEPDAQVQAIELASGWTWFSLNIDQGPLELSESLSSLSPSDGDLIKSQTGFSQYHSELGWRGKIAALEAGQSYQLYSKNGDALRSTGTALDVSLQTITLHRGWNWTGYLGQRIMDINEALASYGPVNGDRIKSQTAFAEYVASVDSWEGSLKQLLPGQGYMLYTSKGGALEYPYLGKINVSYPEKPEWEVDVYGYEYSMSLVLMVEFDDQALRDSTVLLAAFSGSVCCGVGQLEYLEALDRYLVFLPVYGTRADGDSLTFRVYEPGTDKTREVTEKVKFEADRIVGELGTPFVLTAEPIGDELVPYSYYLNQNYPNPFNPETVIEYGLPRDGKVKLEVYNTLGQKVVTLVNENQRARHYRITFNAGEYRLASGVYFYQVKMGDYIKRRKLVFVR